jgi:tetratricopeptide (TPR) repeat protein
MKLNGVTALRVALQQNGFTDLQSTYDALKASNPDFEASEADLNRWGYRLLGAGKTAQALGIFQLIVSLHPDSGNAFDSLASGYEAVGANELAIANYRRSLELDPANDNARDRIRALGGM